MKMFLISLIYREQCDYMPDVAVIAAETQQDAINVVLSGKLYGPLRLLGLFAKEIGETPLEAGVYSCSLPEQNRWGEDALSFELPGWMKEPYRAWRTEDCFVKLSRE